MARRKRGIAEAINWTASTAAASATIALTLLSLSKSVTAYNDCSVSTSLEGSGSLMTPGFPGPYPSNIRCIWILTAEQGKVIRLFIITLDLEIGSDFLTIYNGTSLSRASQLKKLTGFLEEPYEATFSESVTLLFTSDDSLEWRGFEVFFDSWYPPGSTGSAPHNCGAVLRNSAIIFSPNYPNNYPKNIVCTWSLKAEDGKVVKLRFLDFNFGFSRDSLTVLSTNNKDGVNTSVSLGGPLLLPEMVFGPEATLVFNSSGVVQYSGFLLAFTSECESILEIEGNFTSPNYPDYYPGYATCLWYLTAREGSFLTITFSSFDLEPDDSIEVYGSYPFPLIARYTGRNTTGGFSTSFNSSYATLVFYGNTEDARKGGFSASFRSMSPDQDGV